MENPENWLNCLVCNEKTRFYHANAQLCRPCSTFLRRVIAEDIRYECKSGGNCKISISRNTCRSCRFRRCIEAGARLNGPKPPNVASTSSLPLAPKSKTTHILKEIVEAYDQFLYVQRSIHVSLTPEIGLGNKNVLMAQKKLITIVERQSLPPLVTMLNEHYGPFKKLESKQKLDIIAETLPDFGIFHRAYLTGYYFPEIKCNKAMFTNGYFMTMDESLIQWFLDGYIEKNKVDGYFKVIEPLIHKYLKSFEKYKKIGIRKEDTVVMIFLSLWKKIEHANLMNEEMTKYKDDLMQEWIVDLRKIYGQKQSTIQMGKILQFYSYCDDISNELKKVVTYLNVNSLEIDKDQLCEVTEYMKKLDISNSGNTSI